MTSFFPLLLTLAEEVFKIQIFFYGWRDRKNGQRFEFFLGRECRGFLALIYVKCVTRYFNMLEDGETNVPIYYLMLHA